MTEKVVLITGINGQDGILFADYILKKGYKVIGITTSLKTYFSQYYKNYLQIFSFDEFSYINKVNTLLDEYKPDWLVNFMGITSSKAINRFDSQYLNINLKIPLDLLNIFFEKIPSGKFFQPSSAYVFDKSSIPINEKSDKAPSNVYGFCKQTIDKICLSYRQNGYFCNTGYFFSHESYLRRTDSFTRKIIAKMKSEENKNELILDGWNNLNDWSSAENIVEFIFQSLIAEKSDDYVVGSGKIYNVFEFAQSIANTLKIYDPEKIIKGKSATQQGYRLCDPKKAIEYLNWSPISEINQVSKALIPKKLRILNDLPDFGLKFI